MGSSKLGVNGQLAGGQESSRLPRNAHRWDRVGRINMEAPRTGSAC